MTTKKILRILGIITLVIIIITNIFWIYDFFTYQNYPDLKEKIYEHTFILGTIEMIIIFIGYIMMPPVEY